MPPLLRCLAWKLCGLGTFVFCLPLHYSIQCLHYFAVLSVNPVGYVLTSFVCLLTTVHTASTTLLSYLSALWVRYFCLLSASSRQYTLPPLLCCLTCQPCGVSTFVCHSASSLQDTLAPLLCCLAWQPCGIGAYVCSFVPHPSPCSPPPQFLPLSLAKKKKRKEKKLLLQWLID